MFYKTSQGHLISKYIAFPEKITFLPPDTHNQVRLIFLKCCRENLSFHNLCWANKDENIYSGPTNFPSPQANIFLKVTEKNYCLKPPFLRPNRHLLFEFSYIDTRIKCKVCSKLTKEVPDLVLVSSLLILNIFDMLLNCVFC